MTPAIHFDRSRTEAAHKCRRLRYLSYHWGGRGLERRHQAIPLLTGSLIHEPLAAMLMGLTAEQAVAEATAKYWKAVADRGLDIQGLQMEQQEIAEEQVALVEALSYAFSRTVMPRLLDEYEVLEVEREHSLEMAEGMVYMARPDAVFRRRSDSRLVLPDFKTVSNPDKAWRRQWQYDQVTLAQVLPVEAKYGEKVAGVVILGLVKGRWSEYPKDSGRWQHSSPLVWGWRRPPKDANPPFDDGQAEDWQARYEYHCNGPHATNGSKKGCPGDRDHRLSGYYKAPVWREREGGVRGWVDHLLATDVELVEQQFVALPPILRADYEVEEWREATIASEREIADRATAVNDCDDPQERQRLLRVLFPKSSGHGSCTRPSDCPMHAICWGTAGDAPLESGLYQWREFNHPQEAV